MNKKVKNATKVSNNGINFKSKLEASVYKHLLQAGFVPEYEAVTYTLWEGFKPTIPFYDKNGMNMVKIRDIHYTPDFTFNYGNKFIVIEVKGMQNDVFPYKFKMFRKLLELPEYKDTILFEVFSIRQLKECINIIKDDSNRKT